MNAKQEVFDAITGGLDGGAAVDRWQEMSREELLETAQGMDENYYGDTLSDEQTNEVVDAVEQARDATDGNEHHRIRAALDD
jgi:hypothetical protein